MGICECQKNSLMERNLDSNLYQLIYSETEPGTHQIKSDRLKAVKNNSNKRFRADLQTHCEQSSIEEFNRIVPMKYQDYSRENPMLLNYDGDSTKLNEQEPVKLENRNLYWGCWNEKYVIEGTGKMYLVEDNIFVEGMWKEGILYYGRIMFPEGRIYEGEVLDCLFDGQGKLIFPDGTIYEGSFSKGDRDGRGNMVWPDGSKYWGEFSEDQLDGEGEFFWANGMYYRGEFKQNKLHGKGELNRGKKNKYHGEFANNMFNGRGKFIWEDDTVYVGNYLNCKKQGKGRYVIKKGLVFRGKFYDEKPHGPGELSTESKTYQGLWRNGELIEKGEVIKKAISDSTKNDYSIESDININMEFEIKKEDLNPLELKYLDHTTNENIVSYLPKEDIKQSLGDF